MNTLYDTVCINTDDYNAEIDSPAMFEINTQSTQSMEQSISSMCYIKHSGFLFLPKYINKTIYNLDILTENQEEFNDVNMIKNLFKNVISILAYVKRLDSKIDSLIRNNNNTRNIQTVNNDFEKIFPFKYIESVDDMEIKLKQDENTSDQLVIMINYN